MTKTEEIKTRMKILRQYEDVVTRHKLASALLVELINHLAPNSDLIEGIISDYQNLTKFYGTRSH